MQLDSLNLGTLDLIYIIILGISFVFALISLLGAEAGHAVDVNFDAHVDSHTLDFIHVSPFALAAFGATFGLAGLLVRVWLGMGAMASILWASGAGLIFGVAAQLLFVYVLSPTKSSHYSLEKEAVGQAATVIVTVPAAGRGQIALDLPNGRVTLGAQSDTGQQIRTGEAVVIDRIIGRIAFVRPAGKIS